MSATPRISIIALGISLSTFFVVTYVLCVLYGLVGFSQGFHGTLLPMLLPGFVWITWPGFLIGAAWTFAFGWYVAVVFAPLYNVFATRCGRPKGD